MTRPNSSLPPRNYFITIASIILGVLFGWLAVMIWVVEFAEAVPFETGIRAAVCIAFSAVALLLIRTARRGYTKTRVRELILELLSGGF